MRIIKESENEKYCTCPSCSARIGYVDADLYLVRGGSGFECPKCHVEFPVERHACAEFPKAYYHFGVHDGAVDMSNEEINKWIKAGLKEMKKRHIADNNNYDNWYAACGNTIVWMERSDDDAVDVMVAKNYYSTTVNYDWIE